MQKVQFEDVVKSYNGQVGCACGCQGVYTLPSTASIEDANKSVGYDAYSEKDVNDNKVKMAVSKVNRALEEYGDRLKDAPYGGQTYRDDYVLLLANDNFVSFEKGNRVSTVYFN